MAIHNMVARMCGSGIIIVKRLTMAKYVILFFALVFSTGFSAQTLNTHKAGSGQLKVATWKWGKLKWKSCYYQIVSDQHAVIERGEVINENHNFIFNGFLNRGGRMKEVGLSFDERYILFQNDLYFLKVPLYEEDALYFKQKINGMVGRDSILGQWQKICE